MKIWYSVNGWGLTYTEKRLVKYAHIKCNKLAGTSRQCQKCKEHLDYEDAWRLNALWAWCTPPYDS